VGLEIYMFIGYSSKFSDCLVSLKLAGMHFVKFQVSFKGSCRHSYHLQFMFISSKNLPNQQVGICKQIL